MPATLNSRHDCWCGACKSAQQSPPSFIEMFAKQVPSSHSLPTPSRPWSSCLHVCRCTLHCLPGLSLQMSVPRREPSQQPIPSHAHPGPVASSHVQPFFSCLCDGTDFRCKYRNQLSRCRPGARSAERCVRPVRVKQRAETLLGMPGCWMYLGIRGCSICRSPCLFPFFGGPLPAGLGPGPGPGPSPRPCLGSPTPEVHARRALSGLVSSLQVNFQSNQICSPTLATDRHLPLSALPHFPHSAIPTRIPFLSSSPTRLESSSQHPGAFAISHAANLLTQVLEHTHLLT